MASSPDFTSVAAFVQPTDVGLLTSCSKMEHDTAFLGGHSKKIFPNFLELPTTNIGFT